MCASSLSHAVMAAAPTFSLFPIRTVWTLALNARATARPAFSRGRVYFALSGDQFVAYDIVSGKQTWNVTASVSLSPAVGDGLIFFSDGNAIVARRDSDGELVWQVSLDDPLAQPLTWDNGWLMAPTKSGTLYAFRATDGAVIWQRTLDAPASSPAALAADRAYLTTTDGHIVALLVDSGEVEWDRRLGARANRVLALDERLYFGTADKFLYCLNTRDGATEWRFPTGGEVFGLPAIDDRRVYFVSLDNILRALDRRTGNQLWKRALQLRPIGGPIRAGDVILAAGLSAVRGYRVADGAPAGELPASGELAFEPAVVPVDGSIAPIVITVTRDLAKGATGAVFTRSIDPPADNHLPPMLTTPTPGASVTPAAADPARDPKQTVPGAAQTGVPPATQPH